MSTLLSTDMHITRSSTKRLQAPGGNSSISFGWSDSSSSSSNSRSRNTVQQAPSDRLAQERMDQTFNNQHNVFGQEQRSTRDSYPAPSVHSNDMNNRELRELDDKISEVDTDIAMLQEQMSRLQAQRDSLMQRRERLVGPSQQYQREAPLSPNPRSLADMMDGSNEHETLQSTNDGFYERHNPERRNLQAPGGGSSSLNVLHHDENTMGSNEQRSSVRTWKGHNSSQIGLW